MRKNGLKMRGVRSFLVVGLTLTACAPAPITAPETGGGSPESHAVAVPSRDPLTALAENAPAAEAAFLRNLSRLYSQDPSLRAGQLRGQALGERAQSLANPFRPDFGITGSTIGEGNLTLRATQPLIDFGKRNAEIARLSAARGLTEQETAAARAALLAQALTAIEEARHARARITLHRRQITEYRDAERAAQDLVDLNLATATELRLAAVEGQRAQVDLSSAQADLTDAELSWSALMGAEPLPGNVDAGVLRRLTGVATTSAAQDAALGRGTGIRQLQASRLLQEAEVETVRLRLRPTISAEASLALDGTSDATGLGLTLDVPLYRRNLDDDLAEARAELPAIDAEITNARRDVQTAIARAASRAQSQRQLAVQQDKSVALLRARVEDVGFQVRNGLAPYTDVIEARVDMFEAELAALESRTAARTAEAEVLLLSGVLVP